MNKKYQTNADRQRAYRQRHRNARSEPSRRSRAKRQTVTVDPRMKDPRYMYIGEDRGHGVFMYCLSAADRAPGATHAAPGCPKFWDDPQVIGTVDFEAEKIVFATSRLT